MVTLDSMQDDCGSIDATTVSVSTRGFAAEGPSTKAGIPVTILEPMAPRQWASVQRKLSLNGSRFSFLGLAILHALASLQKADFGLIKF